MIQCQDLHQGTMILSQARFLDTDITHTMGWMNQGAEMTTLHSPQESQILKNGLPNYL